MESEEITKLVDGIYKNILDKFNPGTRQMINSGKAYLKALHGAAAASRVYVDAITKLARQAQQATWSGCTDIGSALMQIVEVYKETQAQQMNILKAFYVDVLVPLETNLEKDTKVIQTEQKKFLQDHKQHMESFGKAENMVKKYRKKQQSKTSKSGNAAVDKELKSMQILEEEKNKLDEFCEISLKNAMMQERRRYGFALERQCSLGKHLLAFHSNQQILFEKFINSWLEISKSREYLPQPIENMFANKLRQVNFYSEENHTSNREEEEEDTVSVNSQLRQTKSTDSTCNDHQSMSGITAAIKQHPLVRAKSDFNINTSTLSHHRGGDDYTIHRPMSLAITDNNNWENTNSLLVRAVYDYLSSGENQLVFTKGDIISVIGERNKGWQYGENLRTHGTGWFPLTYTEIFGDNNNNNNNNIDNNFTHSQRKKGDYLSKSTDMYPDTSDSSPDGDNFENGKINKFNGYKPPVTRFGDSIIQRQTHQVQRVQESTFSPVPPPVPTPIVPSVNNNIRNVHTPTIARNQNATVGKKTQNGNASLHSSNDSGFSNDPPPPPDVDYSDDDTNRHMLLKKAYEMKMAKMNNTTKRKEQNSVNNWLNNETNGQNNNRRVPPMRQSSSVGQLVTLGRNTNNVNVNKDILYDKKLKRTKSLWKFKKNEDVLEGMSMWKHRSLVDINSAVLKNNGTPVLDKRMSATKEINVDDSDDENVTIMNKSADNTLKKTNNYKRKNLNIDSDDPSDRESCIVVNDHRKIDSMTMLPRMHISKANSLSSMKIENCYKDNDDSDLIFESSKLQTFKYNRVPESSWYDSWGERKKK